MKVFSYLFITTLKNRILSLRKKPAMLITYLLFAVMAVFFIVLNFKHASMTVSEHNYTDIRMLYSIIIGLGLLVLYSFVSTGLSTGGTLFTMSDVGLLFVAPISPRRILFYGLIKQMGTTILGAIFILFQINTFQSTFGLNSSYVLLMFLIYAMLVFSCQLLSIGIYIYSNGNATRQKLMKLVLYTFLALLAILVLISYQSTKSITEALYFVVDKKEIGFLPIVGWSMLFMKASVEHNMFMMVLGILLFCILDVILIVAFTFGESDYYEDVLKSTEVNFNMKQAVKEGKTVKKVNSKKRIKESEVGIGKGVGAKALFYKHLLEMRRSSKIPYVDSNTAFYVVGAIFISCIMKDGSAPYIICGVLLYIQFFLAILGKLTMEIKKQYIFLIPEKSIKKVFYGSLTSLVKPLIDAILVFTAVCIASRTNPLLNLSLALAYASTSALLVSFSIIYQRFLGGQPNKIISVSFSILLFIVIAVPGVIISVVVMNILSDNMKYLAVVPFTLCNVGITAIIFRLCGDLFDVSEYSGK